MPSLFSRARTTSTQNKQHSLDDTLLSSALDEFGRVSSRNTNRAYSTATAPTSSKKDKKKSKENEKRSRTLSTAKDLPTSGADGQASIPDGAFLPLNLERPRTESGPVEGQKDADYGYLSYERHVVLGIEQAARLVDVITQELTSRGGLSTPFIFTSQALDINSSAIKKLIQSFLNTCTINLGRDADNAEAKWREEARFAGLHELGMCLRWGLAKVVRSVGGNDVRGLLHWELYVEFRDSEAALGYPSSHFSTFLDGLIPPLRSIVFEMLTLLSRLTANSATSGHTPPTLSPLFGPLLFGLGPATLSFHGTYANYLRAVNATEHLLLAFIRWQDAPRSDGSASTLGVPIRLKDWIRGYPAMLPKTRNDEKYQARRGARTVRLLNVRRNIRIYSPDLVKSACTWAAKTGRPQTVNINSTPRRGLADSAEWDRVAPSALKLAPRYSEAYKKRMDMPPTLYPDSASTTSTISSLSTSSYASTSTKASSFLDELGALGAREGEDRFRSLTDLKWGAFETMGFGGIAPENNQKLQFDLTEGARASRAAKRTTLSWNDFSSDGFTRSDDPLKATLQFSTPVINTVSSWPTQNAEMTRKLKKSQKSLPTFGWDTEPILGGEEVIEEAFVDVFCDLIYGGGWMDLERAEEYDRDVNWALIEFKSIPVTRTTASGSSDPRTSTTLFLFEEFVPLEYRQQLALPPSSRRRMPSLFSASKSKQWKQAATLNGRPYIVGHVPTSASPREAEFEGLLRRDGGTKILSPNSNPPITSLSRNTSTPITTLLESATGELPPSVRTDSPAPIRVIKLDDPSDPNATPKKGSRFKLPSTLPLASPGGNVSRRSVIPPAEYSSVDFETRLASSSDDDNDAKSKSKDDQWVDILVGTQTRRMGGQDATMNTDHMRHDRRSDPDAASMEVAQALAAVRGRVLSLESDAGMEPIRDSAFVGEIERVPRHSEDRSTDHQSQEDAAYNDEQDYDDDDPDSPMAKLRQIQQQRSHSSYFDLHPERRPVSDYEDIRSRITADNSDEEESEDQHFAYQVPDSQTTPARSPGIRALPRVPAAVDVPVFDPVPEQQREQRENMHRAKADSTILPANSPEPGAPKPLPFPSGSGGGNAGKTATLIAMFRERESSSTTNSPSPRQLPSPGSQPVSPETTPAAQPSRLPVRSIPKEGGLPVSPSPPKPADPEPVISPSLDPPPRIHGDVSGRESPGRYMHGAPLHNVLEEEEEEE